LRCFIAVGGEGDLAGSLGPWLEGTRAAFPELSVTPTQNLHLTLAFLGELDDPQVGAAGAAVAAAAMAPSDASTGWTLGWGTPDAFPNIRRPRVLWLGVERGRKRLLDVHAVLAAELHSRGLPVDDKPYRPHLTLARVRRPPLPRERAGDVVSWLEGAPPVAELQVGSLVLYRSKLGRPAAVHEPIAEARLG
jgi:2'-5' RNA ligase